ncbi:MAG TPA: peptidoglycan-associated lipoprotein [Verrucomicrobia bacterium]|nr:peptidoglycan-associated lipoprotein [Verrucomicrobiota bacterium]
MKISTIVMTCAVFSVLATGCRYDKAAKGAKGAGDTVASNGVLDDLAAESGTLEDIAATDAAGKSWEAAGFTRCTDVEFAPVYFAFDATAIQPSELGKIEAVAKHLQDNPDRVLTIEGNCDERGSTEYNLSLGENRALIAKNYLVQNDIADSRIKTVSRGEENPAVEGTGEAVWAQNRRDEFLIYKK